jgi:hypothetical protein
VCAGVPFYGPFLQRLGLCNPTTDLLAVFGGAILRPPSAKTGAGVGNVAATIAIADAAITATLGDGANIAAKDHLSSILVVDDTTGVPLSLDYGLGTKRDVAPDGTLRAVSVPFGAVKPPTKMRAYLMIDATPAAKASLAAP